MSRGIYLTLAISATFAVIRIAGATNVFFKDAAHIYVGGLFGAAIVLWSLPRFIDIKRRLMSFQGMTDSQAETALKVVERELHIQAKFYLALGIILSVIETFVAVITRVL